MKAMTYRKFGGPEALHVEEVAEPVPAADEVVLEVKASSINVIDYRARRGILWPLVNKNFPKVPGADAAGTVAAVGSAVSQFKVGDRVVGMTNPFKGGAFAQRVALKASCAARIPDEVDFEQAACLPVAGLAALLSIRDLGKVQTGTHVLINGASGAAGLFALQIAKAFGAQVTAVCGTRGIDLCRTMGADAVVDYRREKLAPHRPFDVILEYSSALPFQVGRKLLTPNGRFVEASPTIPRFIGSMLANPFRSQKHLMLQTAATTADLEYLLSRVGNGQLKVTIAERFPLADAREGFVRMENGGTIGKIIVQVG